MLGDDESGIKIKHYAVNTTKKNPHNSAPPKRDVSIRRLNQSLSFLTKTTDSGQRLLTSNLLPMPEARKEDNCVHYGEQRMILKYLSTTNN